MLFLYNKYMGHVVSIRTLVYEGQEIPEIFDVFLVGKPLNPRTLYLNDPDYQLVCPD